MAGERKIKCAVYPPGFGRRARVADFAGENRGLSIIGADIIRIDVSFENPVGYELTRWHGVAGK